MKTILTLFVLLFSSSVFAGDISDFEIEGMSVGDSLLDYLDLTHIKSEIEESKRIYPYKTKDFSEIYWFNETDNYNYLSFLIKNEGYNKKYIIKGIFGKKHMGLKECLALKKNIVKEYESMFPNTKKRHSKFSPSFDPSGKSIIYYSHFSFDTNDRIAVECYDYSSKDHGKDGLLISLLLYDARLWLRQKM